MIDKVARAAGIVVGTVFFGLREWMRKAGQRVAGGRR